MQCEGSPELFPTQLYHLGHQYQQHSSKNNNIKNGELEALETLTLTIIKRKEEHMIYSEDF